MSEEIKDRDQVEIEIFTTEPRQRAMMVVELPEEHQRFYDKLRGRIEKFVRDKGLNDNLTSILLLAPDLFVLLARLVLDKRVSMQAKTIAGLAIAYYIAPIDLIPEAITGPIGMLDDIVVAVYALRKILVDTDEHIVLHHWNGQDNLLEVITNIIKKADDLVGHNILKRIEEKIFGK
ncbi:YkvA family protein [Brevibacillus dissolubilis]|uniref:YkvA family protein n=1 Tax=Brevibacillus dissolubilis TaxID=1844116 RepID=UPI0011166972|nr:DUF1232 domain-containing protein [Brevibacillus dissolubilis]